MNKTNFETWIIDLKVNANFSSNYNEFFEELYSISNKYVLGGDSKKKKFNGWFKSINNLNAEIISYDNIIKITYLLDNEKYQKRDIYYNTIKKVKGIKISNGRIGRNGNDYFESGLNDDENSLIYYKEYI